jgi:hypothetical protein
MNAVQRAESAGARRNAKPVDPMEMGEQHVEPSNDSPLPKVDYTKKQSII